MDINSGGASFEVPRSWDWVLFFLLFSGPPKLRLRDPSASLEGVIDWVVILQVVTWGLAGIWVLKKLRTRKKLGWKFSSIEKLSLVFVACLAFSIFFSEGPALTIFKVYQLAISVLFTSAFVHVYGPKSALRGIFVGSAILCVADVVAVFIAPTMVFGETELGAVRFTGSLLGETGVVGVFALVLFLTDVHKRGTLKTAVSLLIFGCVSLFSFMRTSYLAFFAFLIFSIWKAPDLKLLKRVTRWALVGIPIAIMWGAVAVFGQYRSSEEIWTLSDRLGLWAYLLDAMWTKSPLFGLGYFAASRIYGPEYNPGLGTAHSVFIEVLVGGGIVSFIVFIFIWCYLFYLAFRLGGKAPDPVSFSALGVLLVTTLFVLIGSELEASPAGFAVWVLVASIPLLLAEGGIQVRSGGLASRSLPSAPSVPCIQL